jgi:hypothetical protein
MRGMSAHKQLIAWGGLLTLVVLSVSQGLHGVLGIETAHAAFNDVFDQGTQTAIANMVSQIVQYMNIAAWSVFVLITMLLSPDFIFDMGAGGGLLLMLNQIWQLARDLMNVIFAFMIVAAAIYTIIKADKSFISEHVGRFLLAVVLVNFSWFFPRVILDVANVSMTAIYGIPSLLATECHQVLGGTWRWNAPLVNAVAVAPAGGRNCRQIPDGNIPGPTPTTKPLFSCDCVVIENAAFFVSDTDVTELKKKDNRWECDMAPLLCIIKTSMNPTTQSSVTTTLNGLVINHARLGTLSMMPEPIGAGNVGELIAFIMREVIVLLIHIALFFPLLAMAVAFLIRVPILWITIAFMPFYFLSYLPFMDKILSGFDPKDKIMKNFLSAAFMPTITAVPLAIGYMMINAALMMPVGAPNAIRFPLISGISSYFQIIWLFMALGVMWVGVFNALKSNEFVGQFTEKIRDIGSSAGKAVSKLPLHIPLPVPGGGNTSPLALAKSIDPRQINRALSNPEGMKQVLEQLRNGGTTPDANRANTESTVTAVKRNGSENQIRDQVRAATANTATRAQVDQLIQTLKNNGATGVTAENLHDQLDRLRRDGRINVADEAQLRDLRGNLDRYRAGTLPPT